MLSETMSLLPLLAIGGGALLLFGLLDDDDASSDDAEPEPGTADDDLIEDYDWAADEDGKLYTLAGNDTVTAVSVDIQATGSDNAYANVYLGEGDDVVAFDRMYAGRIFGEAGDDSVTIGDLNDVRIETGAGDDTVTIGSGADYLRVNLGDGDDHIVIDGARNTDGDQELAGGAGKDTFEYHLAYSEDYGSDGRVYPVTDFTSGEDSLIIDPDTENSGMSYVSHRITDDGNVEVTLTDPENPLETFVTTVAVGRGITLDDVTVIGATPPDEGATEGNDTFTAHDWTSDPDGTLRTLGGDDRVTIDDVAGAIDLGTGNDTFQGGNISDGVKYYDRPIMGGAGNDSLSMTGGDAYFLGGDGNDTLTIEGAGGDYRGLFEGGTGSDTYVFILTPDAESVIDPSSGLSKSAGEIFQFQTGVDKLVIDPTSMAGEATYSHHKLFSHSGDGQQHVAVYFTHPDHPDGLSVDLTLSFGSIGPGDIEIVGHSLNEGTDGDDTITSYDLAADRDGILYTGAGDDTVDLGEIGAAVYLGEGNDVLTAAYAGQATAGQGPYATTGSIDAGAGDDRVVLGGSDSAVEGGAGDDSLTITNLSSNPDDYSALLGRDGDDTLTAHRVSESTQYINLIGGEGEDTFQISLSPDGGSNELWAGYTINLADFNPSEDRLLIDPYSFAGDATYTGFSVNEDGNIVVSFTHPDHADGLSILISKTFEHFKAEDVEIVDGFPEEAAA